jgi:hypothetical protein
VHGHAPDNGLLLRLLLTAAEDDMRGLCGLQLRRGSAHDSEATMTTATRSQENVLLEVLGTQSDSQDAQNQVLFRV